MAIAVVGCHCFVKDRTQAVSFAVPVFMTLAFFFAGDWLVEGRVAKLKSRMVRICLPFVVWALFALVIDRIWLGGALAKDCYGGDATWRSFAIHLVGGTALANNMQMWFIGNLMWLTPIFFLLLRPFHGKLPRWTIAAVGALAVMAQYSGLNKWLWDLVPEFGIRVPGGRLLEMVPYCCVGLLAWSFKDRFAGFALALKLKIALVSLALFIFLSYFKLFISCPGFSYSGLHRASLCMTAIGVFYFFPFERLPAWISRVIGVVAAYSMGVYMTHVIIVRFCEKYVFSAVGIAPKTLVETLAVFAISWIFCFLLARIPACRRLVV